MTCKQAIRSQASHQILPFGLVPTKEAKAELNELLSQWARKHCVPTFYIIKDQREYTIAAEDITENSASGDV
jgi:hypothetical protein